MKSRAFTLVVSSRASAAEPFVLVAHIPINYYGTPMNQLDSAITVLTAMITPAVLISACGSMILSTSSRLGRVVDRVRALSEKLEEISYQAQPNDLTRERQAAIFQQLDKLTSRARLLQRCMVTFYLSLGAFVATSVAIGIVAVIGSPGYTLAPVICGLIGALFLFTVACC
jgi:hypothetical protein